MTASYSPIGYMRTCFTEKFGAPRQPLMIPDATGILKLNPDPAFAQAVEELGSFSHLWIIFVFHQHAGMPWHPRIQPPRAEIKKVGVFASRSPHRPNPIGISAVKLEKIDFNAEGGIEIHVSGVDILDGTPVLDIKPYLPYADSIPEASSGWAESEISRFPVSFSEAALAELEKRKDPRLKSLIEQTLALDPRPISQRKAMPIEGSASNGMTFRFRLAGYDIEWEIRGGTLQIKQLIELTEH